MTGQGGDPMTVWRDIADQLTPAQTASLQRWEAQQFGADELLTYARDLATGNVTDAVLGDVAVPPGATTDGESWSRDHDGRWSRALVWREFPDRVRSSVSVEGRQDASGDYFAGVVVHDDGRDPLTADQARLLAGDLLAAAEILENLAGD